MSDFAKRIKKARIEAGLSQDALAKAISELFDKKKISRTAITQWESSKTNSIEAGHLLKATKILNVTPDWLQFGHGNMRPMDLIDVTTRRLPLFNAQQAPYSQEKYKEISFEIGLDETLAKIASPYAFAFLIADNSMEPLFTCNDLVLIDPEIQPCPGEYVLAKLVSTDAIFLRKYKPTSPSLTNQFELLSLNEDWGNMILTEKNSEIIGTLIEHRCKRRL
jgi:transcriptional regulator with XRE-family HTH domain